jgi:FlaA1/EpsC-like NDP-sugar epimerase
MKSLLKNKKILVTGGSGSIGKELVKKSLTDGASLVRVFSNDENGLYEMELEFMNKKNLEFIIGDIKNADSVNLATKNIDIIFHTAALKHVDRCELFPFEAVTTNIIGTNNIVSAAINQNVKRVVNISTDKAVNPIGVLGATKLLTEKIISTEAFRKRSKTIFSSVRFGNVLHTRGSIIPRIEKQISQGGPITLTDKKMKRFFMTKSESVELIFKAAELAKGGETFVLKMPVLLLNDLFEVMKDILAPKYGFKPSLVKTKIIGIRPGEKIVEYLLTDFEMEHVLETEEFFIMPSLFESINSRKYKDAKKPKNLKNYFNSLKPMNRDKIKEMLKEYY